MYQFFCHKFSHSKTVSLSALLLATAAMAFSTQAHATRVDNRFCMGSAPFSQTATSQNVTAPPIYIGGVRYQVNNSQFAPEYRYRWIRLPPPIQQPFCARFLDKLVLSIPVDGDAGQRLLFDVNGRASSTGTLTASCGSFSGSDQGNKFLISGQQVTGGSCRIMRLELRNIPESASVDLSVQISEQL